MYVMCHTNKHFRVKCFVNKRVIVYALVYSDAYTVQDTGEIRNPYTTTGRYYGREQNRYLTSWILLACVTDCDVLQHGDNFAHAVGVVSKPCVRNSMPVSEHVNSIVKPHRSQRKYKTLISRQIKMTSTMDSRKRFWNKQTNKTYLCSLRITAYQCPNL